MATATTVRGPATVTLELTEPEARSLMAVAGAIMGSGPAREHMYDIHAALLDEVDYPDTDLVFSEADGDSVDVSGGDK